MSNMRDLVVIIPGITGSVLERDGKEIWGMSAGTIVKSLIKLGRNLSVLKVDDPSGENPSDDGIVATKLMPTAHLIPGLWKIDGYSQLLEYLKNTFKLTTGDSQRAGNLLEFAYDWRHSSKVTARRLAAVVETALFRWRTETDNPSARVIFICHSMGGLIARYFTRVLGGHEITRFIVTMGTPYRGSINALSALSKGIDKKLGPLQVDLTELVRSMPSVYELLPTYDCIQVDGSKLQKVKDVAVPGLDSHKVLAAYAVHAEMANSRSAGCEVIAIKGIAQPTWQTARLVSGALVEQYDLSGSPDGDGTVPRISSHPPEDPSDFRAVFLGQQHGSLQADPDALRQIFGVLTSQPYQPAAGEHLLGVSVPDAISSSEVLPITARSNENDHTLQLQYRVTDDNNFRAEGQLRNLGNGQYEARVADLPGGHLRVQISAAAGRKVVKPVSALTLAIDPHELA